MSRLPPHRNSSIVDRFTSSIQITDASRVIDEQTKIIDMFNSLVLNLPDADSNEIMSSLGKLTFFIKNNVETIFVSLVTSTLFKLVTDFENTSINFQGANAKIAYYAVNILPISKIYKNIPYYTFPNEKYWTIIQITPDKSWVDEVTFFSITLILVNTRMNLIQKLIT